MCLILARLRRLVRPGSRVASSYEGDTMKHLKKLALCALIGLGAACGDDDGGGSGATQVDTGVPEATVLADVTPAQFMQLCTSVGNALEANLGSERFTRGICEAVGAIATDDAASCRDLADQCVSDGAGGVDVGTGVEDFECGDIAQFEGCSVTIAQFETCLNDALSTLNRFFEELSCAHAGTINQSTMPMPPEEAPASCTRLESECPGSGLGIGDMIQ